MRNLEEMAIFAKVGDLESISGAARALNLPKSTVSRAVSRLESAYSARLVERTTRRVALTEIGRALHAHCRNLVSEAENAEAEIAAYQGHPSGRLRVAAHTAIGRNILGPFIPEFLTRYPDVDLHLLLTDRLLSPLADDIDVAIRIGWLEDSSLIARKITEVAAILVASPAYAEKHGLPEAPEELDGHTVIGFPIVGAPALVLVSGRERVQVPIWKRFACNDPLLNLVLVEQGAAIAPISAYFAAERIRRGELIHVLPKYRLEEQPAVYALYAGRTALSPKIAVFLDFMSELAVRIRAEPQLIRA